MEMQKFLRGPALNETVKEYIKSFILEKKLKPGDPLPTEAQIAMELGVGRSSVREAVKALQAAGIVEVRHGQGLFVREYNLDSIMENLTFGIRFSMSTFMDWLQIRAWLENNLIDDVVRQITTADMVRLETILRRWQASVDNGVHLPELDQQFHLALYRPLHNKTLTSLIAAFWEAYQSYEYTDIRNITIEQARQTIDDHWNIYRALFKRDGEAAKKYLSTGFDAYTQRIQELQTMEAQNANTESS